MSCRFVSIWFRHLKTDWFCRRDPALLQSTLILVGKDHGRMIVTAANLKAQAEGIYPGMAVADARAIFPGLTVLDDVPDLEHKLLKKLAEWCIRYSPVVAIDLPDGLLLDVSGCPHLWGSEEAYMKDIHGKLTALGYRVRAAMADTTGTAWAVARFGTGQGIIQPGEQVKALMPLPPSALRLETGTVERLLKLGLNTIQSFLAMPKSALRRRFGKDFLQKLDYATGNAIEFLEPVFIPEPYSQRLPAPDPIVNINGINIAIEKLLHELCGRMSAENKGIRQLRLKCYRVDGKVLNIEIGTHQATINIPHLTKLFETKTDQIEPALGIELFVMEAFSTEDLVAAQESFWSAPAHAGLHQFIDRIANKSPSVQIRKYLPAAHYWPERSFIQAVSIDDAATEKWRIDKPRPVHLLKQPEAIGVSAPVPDYPPMLFRYKGKVHHVKKADGPERIEREWWIDEGPHRDYYAVEDQDGNRFWLFRSGHYDADKTYQWFIHGFFS
ncbi:MAG: DNA polymerase Y family protein [Chitinophagaceae bacterium]|nr:MAG: DNA polymerase Y family protein [Chitinophagaceae bacterium]